MTLQVPLTQLRCIVAVCGASLVAGCVGFDGVIREQNTRINTLQTQLGSLEEKRTALVEKQAVEKEAALKNLHNAQMERVKTMTDYVWAIEKTNAHNPVASNYKVLIGEYSQLSLAASPFKPSPEFQSKYQTQYQPLEAPTVTVQQIQDTLTKTEFNKVMAQVQTAALKQEDLNRLTDSQKAQLRAIEDQISSKKSELIAVTRKAYDVTRAKLEDEQNTLKLYGQLVWVFGGCAGLAVIAAAVCCYLGNIRMATYAGLAAAAFTGCAFLTAEVSQNRWIIWVVFGGGTVFAAGTIFIRQGWGLRNNQLVGFAGKRSSLVRYIEIELKKKLQDFGLGPNETLDTLDLHEVEKLQDDLLAYLKKEKLPVPAFLKA